MKATARVFKSGNSQAVRLPRAFRFDEDVKDVQITREGERLVLEPVPRRHFSEAFLEALGALPGFQRPPQVRQRRRKLFP